MSASLENGNFVRYKDGRAFNIRTTPDYLPKPTIARVRNTEGDKVWLDYRLGWTHCDDLELISEVK